MSTSPTTFERTATLAGRLAQLAGRAQRERELRALVVRTDALLTEVECVNLAAEVAPGHVLPPQPPRLKGDLGQRIAAALVEVANALDDSEMETTPPARTSTALDRIYHAQERLFRCLHAWWRWDEEDTVDPDGPSSRGPQLKTVEEACEFVTSSVDAAMGRLSHATLIGRKGSPATLDLIEQAVERLARSAAIEIEHLPAGGRRYSRPGTERL